MNLFKISFGKFVDGLDMEKKKLKRTFRCCFEHPGRMINVFTEIKED